MSLRVTDKEIKKLIEQLGYKGCENCQHQLTPLRSCWWTEQGGDGHIHFICPKWDKKDTYKENNK